MSTLYLAGLALLSFGAAMIFTLPLRNLMRPIASQTFRLGEPIASTNLRAVEDGGFQDFSIHFKTKFTAKADSGYQNLFQTAPLNSGVRYEISPSGDAAFIWAQDSKSVFVGPIMQIQDATDYVIEVHANIEKMEQIINGKKEEFRLRLAKSPLFNNVAILNGFDSKRPFKGNVQEFQLEISLFRCPPPYNGFFADSKYLASLPAVSLLCFSVAHFSHLLGLYE